LNHIRQVVHGNPQTPSHIFHWKQTLQWTVTASHRFAVVQAMPHIKAARTKPIRSTGLKAATVATSRMAPFATFATFATVSRRHTPPRLAPKLHDLVETSENVRYV